jgi:peptidyl-prolyl cis-trans isomerase A (cyclophilin A)
MNATLRTRFALAAFLALAAGAAFAQQTPSSPPAKPAEDLPDGPTPQAAALVHPNGPHVIFDTSMGRISCQFYEKQAPKTVANFIALAEGTKDWIDPTTHKKMHNKRLYDGTIFHRVIPEFMIQGGDPTGTGMGDPGYTFEDEFDPNLNFDQPGRLAMANNGPNTDGSQFFITEKGYDSLNQHYTLFGQCDDESVEIVKAIARVERNSDDKPLTDVVLKKVTIVRGEDALPPNPAAAAPGATPKRIAISAGVASAMLQSKVPPAYPIAAKSAGVSGTVVLGAVIGGDGSVEELKVISGPAELQQAALDAVRQWKYQPYLLNGNPIEVQTFINVVFALGK